MDNFEAKISGIAEVKRALFAYNNRLGVRVAQMAVRQGANFMLRQIRSAAPVKIGRLKRSIKVKNSRINRVAKNGSVGVYITIDPGKKRNDMKGAWYGKFVELGYNKGSKLIGVNEAIMRGVTTRDAHTAKKLSNRKYQGRDKQGIRYRHGGRRVPGKHFVSSTFKRTKDQAAHIIIDAFELAGNRVAQELGLKGS